MRKQVLFIVCVALTSFLIGTMFSMNYFASGKQPSVWDAINQLQIQINALTTTVNQQQAQITELQSKVNSLNTSLVQLQSTVEAIEEKQNQIKTIRFVEPSETMNDQATYKDAAVFVWTPEHSTDNAILSINCYFQYKGPEVGVRLVVNEEIQGNSIGWLSHLTYTYSRFYPDVQLYPTQDNCIHLYPNQPSYTIRFQFERGSPQDSVVYVKDINIILTVFDGLPASG